MDGSLPGSSVHERRQEFPGKNTGVDYHFLLQEIFPTQGLNPGLPHCRLVLYHLSHQGSTGSLLKRVSTESVMPSNHLVLCHPLLFLPSSLRSIRVFSNELVLPSGGQSIGVSASVSVIPMNIQDWFPLGLTGLISLLSKGLSRVFSSTIQKHQFFSTQPSLWSNSHTHTWPLEKLKKLNRPLLAK